MNLRQIARAISILALSAAHALAAPMIEAPVVDTAPALEADLSSPAWSRAATARDFVALGSGSEPTAETEAHVLCTSDALYVAFVCHEPQMDQLLSEMSGRDAHVWGDDAVELLVAPSGGIWMYHLIVNPDGVLWDGLHGEANMGGDVDLEGVEIATTRGDDRWSARLRIPFAALGATAHPGEVWGINFGRERKAGKGGNSSGALTDSFTTVATLGEMKITGEGAPERLTILSRGGTSAAFNEFGYNVFEVAADAPEGQAVHVALSVTSEGRDIGSHDRTVDAGTDATVSVPYTVPTDGEPLLHFAAAVDGEEVYATDVRALPAT